MRTDGNTNLVTPTCVLLMQERVMIFKNSVATARKKTTRLHYEHQLVNDFREIIAFYSENRETS